jgi:hypothetical protein
LRGEEAIETELESGSKRGISLGLIECRHLEQKEQSRLSFVIVQGAMGGPIPALCVTGV